MNRQVILITCFLISSCTSVEPVTISFEARLNGLSTDCAAVNHSIQLTDLRFYVHDIKLVSEHDAIMPLVILADGRWQNSEVALIDLENGQGTCVNGSKQMNAAVQGFYSGGQITGLQFKIGVPEELNHKDPLEASTPLGYSDMHWHWASGYKFLRAGVKTANDGFFIHLGSSRCEGTIGNIKSCRSPNRPSVHLRDFKPARDVVTIDLSSLVSDVNLEDGILTDCQSSPADQECERPFASLGLNFITGTSIGTAPSFSARPQK